MNNKQVIGRVEYAWLVELGVKKVPARIDTGARTSALWASEIKESASGLEYVLFGPKSPLYTGEKLVARRFTKIVVASSNGQAEERYRIPMTVQLKGRRIRTFCTLADRSKQAFPLLVGRNTLRGKFIVDVQIGARSLDSLDQNRYDQLQSQLGKV